MQAADGVHSGNDFTQFSRMSRRSGRLQAKNVKCDSENECPAALAPRKRKYEEMEPTNEHQQDAQRHKYEIQGCWSQITTGTVTPCILIETPQKETEKEISPDMSKFTRYRFKNLFISPCPLPELSWATPKDVWVKMLDKENRYVHSSGILRNHSALNNDMRVILMDWLIEVSEVYSLHRETFYLAQDFFDRFMSTQSQVGKSMLQVIGVTCLFIASKLEEIYPPKINEFAYVTDGACCEDDIINMELIILKALKWELCPVTAIAWLNLYLQVSSLKDMPKLLLPQYSQEQFIHIAQLLDLCILDSSALDFKYRILAAAALYHHTSMEIVTKATGLAWESISECVQWMAPCARAARRFPPVEMQMIKKVMPEDLHNIQTHTNYLEMMDEIAAHRTTILPEGQSPVSIGGILTPPKSTEKNLSSGESAAGTTIHYGAKPYLEAEKSHAK